MKDSDIIKALECCINADCVNCPNWSGEWYSGMCNEFLASVLDLINRQKAELADEKEKSEMCAEVIARQDKERAVIVNDRNYLLKENNKLQEQIKAAKSEAIKEFAERLKDKAELYSDLPFEAIAIDDIDTLVKEMVGE